MTVVAVAAAGVAVYWCFDLQKGKGLVFAVAAAEAVVVAAAGKHCYDHFSLACRSN